MKRWGIKHNHLLLSVNAGETWSQVRSQCNVMKDSIIRTAYIPNHDQTLIFTGTSGIYISSDNGLTCTQSNIKTGEWLVSPALDGNVLLASDFNGTVERSTDEGLSWHNVQMSLPNVTRNYADHSNFDFIYNPANNKKVYAINESKDYQPYVWYSVDGGVNWNYVYYPQYHFASPFLFSASGKTFLVVLDGKGIWQASGNIRRLQLEPTSLGHGDSDDNAKSDSFFTGISYQTSQAIAMQYVFPEKGNPDSHAKINYYRVSFK